MSNIKLKNFPQVFCLLKIYWYHTCVIWLAWPIVLYGIWPDIHVHNTYTE